MPKANQRLRALLTGLTLAAPITALALHAPVTPSQEVDDAASQAYKLYVDLHQHPELSGNETQTSAKLAAALKAQGYTVTEHIGGTGFVAILKNGAGPTIMLRSELDALPVEEKTGLPFASKVRAKDPNGRDVGVGHMCGHDVHMSALVATAGIMARLQIGRAHV